jgi:hypothetical protein
MLKVKTVIGKMNELLSSGTPPNFYTKDGLYFLNNGEIFFFGEKEAKKIGEYKRKISSSGELMLEERD